jgi:hypothetical protein
LNLLPEKYTFLGDASSMHPYVHVHYIVSRRFIKNKPEINGELFEVLNKIERFIANAAINSKTQIKINTFFK